MAEAMGISLDEAINIDKVAGSAESVGTGWGATAAADGYTMCIGYRSRALLGMPITYF